MKIFRSLLFLFFLGLCFPLQPIPTLAAPTAATYYVSFSGGSDGNNGLSSGAPFQTIAKVNGLNLQAGDQVLFKCGDTWRGEMLTITQSGTAGQPITFTSYPAGCAEQPVISGAQPITGWSHQDGGIYSADLNTGANAGKFGFGVNQLFRDERRLILGRWPNIDAPDGGYATVESQPAGTQLRDSQLPAGNWTGAVLHIKSIRWAILNRRVSGSSGDTLTLEAETECWGGCTGWGYFLNNHLTTLDQDGEWYYDPDAGRVYLFSTGGAPADGEIEAGVILKDDDRSWGGITLGDDLADPVSYVTVENLAIARWFKHGIATPTNLHPAENHNIRLSGNTIRDVDGIGINLATWVWGAEDGRPDGWRGGYDQVVSGNTIERANSMGINTFSRNSTFSENIIRDVGLIANLGARGMGCGYAQGGASGGICTEDGDGIRVKVGKPDDTGHSNTFTANRLERIAYNGFDVFGYSNHFGQNVIVEACIAKGDCGGVRTFGSDNLNTSNVHDLTFDHNILIDTLGNTDGCHPDFDDLFGFGFYIDHYSRDISLIGNTVISSTVHGILFQNSTGTVRGNTLYNNARTYPYAGAQVIVGNSPAYVSDHTENILFNLYSEGRTLSLANAARLGTSEHNDFFNPTRAKHIRVDGDKTLAEWQAVSGKDAHSQEHWYTQNAGEAPKSRIFYNDSAQAKIIDLGSVLYLDLDQNPVSGQLSLAPYTSQILIESGEAADLDVRMALLSPPDTAPGAPLTYTIQLSNVGILDAEAVSLENLIPAEIVATAWESTPSGASLKTGTRYEWQIASVEVNTSYTFTITGRYANDLPPGRPLRIHTQAETTSPEADPTNNQDQLLLGDWQIIYLPIIQR